MKHILLFLFLGASSVACAESSAVDWKLDFPAMQSFLQELKSTHKLPSRFVEPLAFESSDEQLSEQFVADVGDIEQRVFGKRDLIALKTCADCSLLSDYVGQTIYVQPSFIADLLKNYGVDEGRVVSQFMVAHEISHFVQEASIGHVQAGKSINGFVSLYDQVDLLATGISIADLLAADRLSHAEVDAYGLLILRDFMSSAPLTSLKFLQNQLENDRLEFQKTKSESYGYSVDDLKFRLERLKEVISQLWKR